MKILFMGTPDFARVILDGLCDSHEVIAVFCQPDKKKGRRGKVVSPPVKSYALQKNIPVYQPVTLKSDEAAQDIQSLDPDIIIVAAYGKILPRAILDIPRHGCLNVHASLLPLYRGASPIQWALFEGTEKTGVSIMLMDEGMDTGPVLTRKVVPIKEDDEYYSLSGTLAEAGRQVLLEVIPQWVQGNIKPQPQDDTRASITPLLKKEMGLVSWHWNTRKLLNHLRAFRAYPGSYTFFREKKIILEKMNDFSSLCPTSKPVPGEIIEVLKKEGIVVRTGDGAVLLSRLAIENKSSMSGRDFVNGYQPRAGEKLFCP